jgi:hypothetical protein
MSERSNFGSPILSWINLLCLSLRRRHDEFANYLGAPFGLIRKDAMTAPDELFEPHWRVARRRDDACLIVNGRLRVILPTYHQRSASDVCAGDMGNT